MKQISRNFLHEFTLIMIRLEAWIFVKFLDLFYQGLGIFAQQGIFFQIVTLLLEKQHKKGL